MELLEKKLRKSANVVLYGIFSFHYIELLCLAVYALLKINKIHIEKNYFVTPLKVLAVMVAYGVISCHLLGYSSFKLLQQSCIFIVFFALYTVFFSATRINLQDLFKKYLLACYYVSILAYIQIFIYFVFNFDIFSFGTWLGETQLIQARIIRPRAFCPESGHLGTIFSPALVYIIFFKDKLRILHKKKFVILSLAMLTMSMNAYISICAALYFRFISKRKITDYFFLCVILLWGVTSFVNMSQNVDVQRTDRANFEGIKMRVFETGAILFSLEDLAAIEGTNSSTYALASNFYVAMKAPLRILGTGLGTHRYNYQRINRSNDYYAYGLNSEDGYSLLNRIFSEFGIVGLFLYLFAVFRRVDRHDIISFSLLFYIIGAFLRGGNYFVSGLIFFHYFFFIAKSQYYKREKLQQF
jgi:hypothetical protein